MKSIKYKYLQGSLPENTEWWTDKDYENHSKVVEGLKETGEYMKETEVEIHYKELPLFDNEAIIKEKRIDSYKFILLDLKSRE